MRELTLQERAFLNKHTRHMSDAERERLYELVLEQGIAMAELLPLDSEEAKALEADWQACLDDFYRRAIAQMSGDVGWDESTEAPSDLNAMDKESEG